ncbi:MAG: glutathione peroxidase [Candidatus Kapaibacterium sp.]
MFLIMACGTKSGDEMDVSVYDFSAKTIDGEEKSLADYKGKVMLIVNVASECGFTKQYEGLQELYEKYNDKGLIILGFPCNQFGNQEPGGSEEIQKFCKINYGVTFPLFEKIEVNGDNTHPLYAYLKKAAPGALSTEAIKWNFTKFLVDKEGRVASRFAPQTTPESIQSKITELL